MDRRKMLAMLGLSPALVAGSPAYAGTAAKAAPKSSPAAGDSLITVMNPAIPGTVNATRPLSGANTRPLAINDARAGPTADGVFSSRRATSPDSLGPSPSRAIARM